MAKPRLRTSRPDARRKRRSPRQRSSTRSIWPTTCVARRRCRSSGRRSAAWEGTFKRRVGEAGIRCALAIDAEEAATDFLNWQRREFPHDDPSILYLSQHVHADLAKRAAVALAAKAPKSPEYLLMKAELAEEQSDWENALETYRSCSRWRPNGPASISAREK